MGKQWKEELQVGRLGRSQREGTGEKPVQKPREAPLGPSYPLPLFPREPAPAWPPVLRTLSPCPHPASSQLPISPGLAASSHSPADPAPPRGRVFPPCPQLMGASSPPCEEAGVDRSPHISPSLPGTPLKLSRSLHPKPPQTLCSNRVPFTENLVWTRLRAHSVLSSARMLHHPIYNPERKKSNHIPCLLRVPPAPYHTHTPLCFSPYHSFSPHTLPPAAP